MKRKKRQTDKGGVETCSDKKNSADVTLKHMYVH